MAHGPTRRPSHMDKADPIPPGTWKWVPFVFGVVLFSLAGAWLLVGLVVLAAVAGTAISRRRSR